MENPTRTIQIILSLGQSLSVGATSNASRRVLSTSPVGPDTILSLDFGPNHNAAMGWGSAPVNQALFSGFTALRESGTETHVSGMMAALRDSYDRAGLSAPTLLHINAGMGGRSILELMTPQSMIFRDTATALESTSTGDVFAISTNNGSFEFYQRTADGFSFEGTRSGPLVYMDNLRIQLQLAVAYARSEGFDIAPTVVFSWIQGQDDTSHKYDQYLNELIDDVNDMVDATLGSDASVATIVSQTRGYGSKVVSLDQLQVITERQDVGFGASEFEFQARYPARVNGDYTHLNPEGYFQMGQRIGRNIFDMIHGQENKPILFDRIEQIDARTVIVTFSGVDTHLVNDTSRYAAGNLMLAPANMGFFAYGANGSKPAAFAISSAEIIGQNVVRLNFGQDIVGDFTLFLGRTPEDLLADGPGGLSLTSFGGTTLRDAGSLATLPPTGGAAIPDPYLYEFAPIQSRLVAGNRAPQLASTHSVRMGENSLGVVDLAAVDDQSAEGRGLVYSITGGPDAQLFSIDPTTGQVSFRSVPNFEASEDSNRDNVYQLNVGVTDALGASASTVISVTITNVNEAPNSLVASVLSVDRNAPVGTTIGWLAGSDEDAGSVLTYGLVSATSSFVAIDRSTGRVYVSDSARLLATTDPITVLTARVSDSAGLGFEQQFSIALSGQAPSSVRYVGSAGADVANYSGPLPWLADGGDGDDRLTGGSGNDVIEGGSGNDRLSGGIGDDRIFGGEGADILAGGAGSDLLDGGNGDDRLDGSSGADTMRGGAGNDLYYIDDAADLVFETDALGADSGGNDRIIATVSITMPDFVEQATLTGNGNLAVHGNGSNNVITGNAGNNMLTGGAGDDRITAGDGDDILIGGPGRDTLIGGNGADSFVFTSLSDGVDLISGFASGTDKIVLSAALFGTSSASPGQLDPAMFAIGTAATLASHRVIYDPVARALLFDPDGVGSDAAVRLATFSSSTVIGVTDLLVA